MYTGFQFIGKIKKEYVKFVETITSVGCVEFNWKDYVSKYPFLEKFAKLPSSCMIPFGCFTAYNEDKFGIKDSNHNELIASWFNEFGNTEYTWTFACDLKDYDNEIETFIENVATKICSEFVGLCWYEEEGFPKIYLFRGDFLEVR